MSKLIVFGVFCVTAVSIRFPSGAFQSIAQEPPERDRILTLIEKLGGKATLDEHSSERPVVGVDI